MNIKLPPKTWINANAATGIAVGKRIIIENLTPSTVRVVFKETQPTSTDSFSNIEYGKCFETDELQESPIWLFDFVGGGVDIREFRDRDALLTKPILPLTAFGEISVAEDTPVVQSIAVHGLSAQVSSFAVHGGATVNGDNFYKAYSGTSANGLGAVLSSRQVSYRAGEGIKGRCTAIFDTPVVGNVQHAGLITATDRIGFGYNIDGVFGAIFEHQGQNEIQELTVSVAAAGSENATITVDGNPYTVPLTAGTTNHNANEIANSLNSQVDDFDFSANQNVVLARSLLSIDAGVFNFSSATASASWSQITDGELSINDFIPQDQWNGYKFTELDTTKGNVYQVKTQYLGFGAIFYSIENPTTGHFELAHMQKYANANLKPSFTNPAFRVGVLSENRGSTTSVEIKGASMYGAKEGKKVSTEPPRSINVDRSAETFDNAIYRNVLTLRNRLDFKGLRNRIETALLDVFAYSDKVTTLKVTIDADFSGELNFVYLDKDSSTTEFATNWVDVSGGREVGSFPVTTAGKEIDLEKYDLLLQEGQTVTFSAITNGGAIGLFNLSALFREEI